MITIINHESVYIIAILIIILYNFFLKYLNCIKSYKLIYDIGINKYRIFSTNYCDFIIVSWIVRPKSTDMRIEKAIKIELLYLEHKSNIIFNFWEKLKYTTMYDVFSIIKCINILSIIIISISLESHYD